MLNVTLCTHMELPDRVVWSKNGWYIQLVDGSYRWVCGLTEIKCNPPAYQALCRVEGEGMR